MFLLGLHGSLLASPHTGIGLRVVATAILVPVGFALLAVASEPVIDKFDAHFSGLQFLLSMDRKSYAAPLELFGRYCFLHLAMVLAISLAQRATWTNARSLTPKRFRFATGRVPENRVT
jgi:hypothetical protein